MPLFRYKAITPEGEVAEGEMEAADEAVVIERLREAGQLPVRAEAVAPRPVAREHSLFSRHRSIDHARLGILTRELARLLGAGVALDRSLTILLSVTDNDRERALLTRLLEGIRGGAGFAEAIAAQGAPFNRLYVSMVRAGEEGGALPLVMARLADYLESARELRARVGNALIYPLILLAVSILSLILLLTLVVPQFQRMFDEAGAALPLPTQVVVGIADWLQAYWWTLLAALLVLLLAVPRLLQRPAVHRIWDRYLLRLPLVGSLIRRIEVARFCRTLSTLLSNGVTLLDALTIVRETLGNSVLAAAVGELSERLKGGDTLSGPMLEQGVFPKLACHLVRVGEETGRLDAMLLDVAEIYDREVGHNLSRLLSLLEPALILTLGVLIAGIIFSILIALLGINELAI